MQQGGHFVCTSKTYFREQDVANNQVALSRPMQFLTAVASEVPDALEAFGITEKYLPIAAVHDTHRDIKWVMASIDAGAKLNENMLMDFYNNVLAGKLEPTVATSQSDELR